MGSGVDMIQLLVKMSKDLTHKDTIFDMMLNELNPKEIDYFMNCSELDLNNIAKEFNQYLKFVRAKELMKPLEKKDLLKDVRKRMMLHDDNKNRLESEYSQIF